MIKYNYLEKGTLCVYCLSLFLPTILTGNAYFLMKLITQVLLTEWMQLIDDVASRYEVWVRSLFVCVALVKHKCLPISYFSHQFLVHKQSRLTWLPIDLPRTTHGACMEKSSSDNKEVYTYSSTYQQRFFLPYWVMVLFWYRSKS